jgi:cytosine/adenosine deaminase-related metal-dependent hydrolase
MSKVLIIQNAAVATVDAHDTEYGHGYLVARDGRIEAVGHGDAPPTAKQNPADEVTVVDGTGCLLTPGLVNTHHHLYQWLTRGLAQDEALFGWLTELYPIWARIDEDTVGTAARGGLAWLAKTGCTTSSDHHYVFPEHGGDLLAAEIDAAGAIGLRFHATRGSMSRGRSQGGLPPDECVEEVDAILRASQEAIDRFHDPAFDAMVRVALAPCSPFSVTDELMRLSAEMARASNVRLHTHLCETVDEEEFCLATHGLTPVDYAESVGWLGEDVWFAHAVHLSDAAVKKLGATGTGTTHCPSSNARLGAGHAPVRALLNAGVPVGLGVDGAASQESGMMVEELRQAMYTSRLRAGNSRPQETLGARAALRLGTMGGARNLGRQHEIGSLEPGKLADLALWDLTGLGHAGIADPLGALVFGPPAPVRLLTVGGRAVVRDAQLLTADETALARECGLEARRLVSGR